MKKKLIFSLLAALSLMPWPVAYAYDKDMAGQASIPLEAAAPDDSPRLNAYGNAIGGVTPGDLFYIDTENMATDIPVTLYITNTDELVHYYRYLTLKVGVYIQTDTGQWEKVTTDNGQLPADTYITMLNSKVSFTLPGYARYKIAIDRGSFYCYGTKTDENSISPTFYLTTG